MSRVFGRDAHASFPTAVRAQGMYIYDANGKAYLDASGGAAVSCLGHGHPVVLEAIKSQVDRLGYAHTGYFTNEPQEALAEQLVSLAPPGISRAFIVTGGSEATEAALKLSRQYHVERGESQRVHFISRRFSYHGNTLGALSVSGHVGRRSTYLPLLMPAELISPCFAYRNMRESESSESYGIRVANELEFTIERLGSSTVAAFIAETVVGATIGAVPAVAGYFKRIREICSRHGVLLILDEVMCGMGRTGTLHACEQEGITPDLLLLAKGLGAGYQPIGAMLVAENVYAAIRDGSGAFNHGHTYMGHAVGCAAALKVQEVIQSERLLENVRIQGEYLGHRLREQFAHHPYVGDIRGRGLFWAIELVEDRTKRTPFAAAQQLHRKIKEAAMNDGLICYPSGGTADGVQGDHVLIAPPFIASMGHIEEIVVKLANSVDRALCVLRDQAALSRTVVT